MEVVRRVPTYFRTRQVGGSSIEHRVSVERVPICCSRSDPNRHPTGSPIARGAVETTGALGPTAETDAVVVELPGSELVPVSADD